MIHIIFFIALAKAYSPTEDFKTHPSILKTRSYSALSYSFRRSPPRSIWLRGLPYLPWAKCASPLLLPGKSRLVRSNTFSILRGGNLLHHSGVSLLAIGADLFRFNKYLKEKKKRNDVVGSLRLMNGFSSLETRRLNLGGKETSSHRVNVMYSVGPG